MVREWFPREVHQSIIVTGESEWTTWHKGVVNRVTWIEAHPGKSSQEAPAPKVSLIPRSPEGSSRQPGAGTACLYGLVELRVMSLSRHVI